MTDHRVICGDSLHVLPTLDAESVDAIVCDPPYGLSFMGKEWDHGVPGEAFWREALRVAKPGAHLLAFGGTRTYHRLTCAIEDAGWEIRDCLSYLYGSGFPKSHNLDKTGVFCGCEQASERDVRRVPNADVPTPVQSQPPAREVLLAGLPESGASAQWAEAVDGSAWPRESGVEGGRDVEASEGELLGGAVRPCAGVGVADGAEGRLHRGASAGDGAANGASARPSGSGASPEPRSVGQQAGELGTVAHERLAQEGGVWPTCERCGKPRIPRGLGTALKPAWEPVIVARKPLVGTVASNVAQYGTGAVNVDGCRIATTDDLNGGTFGGVFGNGKPTIHKPLGLGRWPANVVLDEDAAAMLDAQTGANVSRFLYTAKASRREREAGLEGMDAAPVLIGAAGHKINPMTGREVVDIPRTNHHPTVKPIALMRWLCRLVTPPNGLVLDPFTGSGSTGCAAVLEGFRFVGIEREPEYAAIAEKRIAHWAGQVETPEPSLFDG